MTRRPAATAARTVTGRRSIVAGALARLASITAPATILWPDGLATIGIETLNLPILAAGGLLLVTGALVTHRGRHDGPASRLALLVVSALSTWAVPYVLAVNLALADFALTEPGEICHDVPCRDGLALTASIVFAALASIADALLSTAGAVRMCRGLPTGPFRRSGWTVLTGGALLTAAGVVFHASRW